MCGYINKFEIIRENSFDKFKIEDKIAIPNTHIMTLLI